MDPKNLSKQKYIYKLYQANGDVWHVEKYSIVYANSEFVYFKIANKQELCRIWYSAILDNINHSMDFLNDYRNSHGFYFWNDPKDCIGAIKDIRKKNLEKRMDNFSGMIYGRRREIERMEAEVEKIKKELEKLEEANDD